MHTRMYSPLTASSSQSIKRKIWGNNQVVIGYNAYSGNLTRLTLVLVKDYLLDSLFLLCITQIKDLRKPKQMQATMLTGMYSPLTASSSLSFKRKIWGNDRVVVGYNTYLGNPTGLTLVLVKDYLLDSLILLCIAKIKDLRKVEQMQATMPTGMYFPLSTSSTQSFKRKIRGTDQVVVGSTPTRVILRD